MRAVPWLPNILYAVSLLGGDVGLNTPFAFVDDADGIQYLDPHEALQDVGLRTGL